MPVDSFVGAAGTSIQTLRGMLTIPALQTGRFFMFNPNNIDDDKGTNYGAIDLPGASHPVQQFGSGGERIIKFDLWIDGERGRFGRAQARNVQSLSIVDELTFYRSLEYPVQYGGDFSQVFPYTVLFSFGKLYKSVPCIVKKADWRVNFWVHDPNDGDLIPVKATIPIVLSEIPAQSVTYGTFLGNYT